MSLPIRLRKQAARIGGLIHCTDWRKLLSEQHSPEYLESAAWDCMSHAEELNATAAHRRERGIENALTRLCDRAARRERRANRELLNAAHDLRWAEAWEWGRMEAERASEWEARGRRINALEAQYERLLEVQAEMEDERAIAAAARECERLLAEMGA